MPDGAVDQVAETPAGKPGRAAGPRCPCQSGSPGRRNRRPADPRRIRSGYSESRPGSSHCTPPDSHLGRRPAGRGDPGLRAPRCGRNHRPGSRQFSPDLRLDAPAGARPQAGRAGLVCRRRLHEPADRNPRPQSRTSWDQKRLTWCRNNSRQLETGTLARGGRAVLACGRPGGSCPRSARTGRPLAAIRWPGAAGARSLPPPRGCQLDGPCRAIAQGLDVPADSGELPGAPRPPRWVMTARILAGAASAPDE